MTTLDTLALYERILGLVEPSVLHCTSNVILQEDYAAVAASLSDVAATFAKVKEVRHAVNQLEQNKASAGRSKSLMKAMDSLIQSQNELHNNLEKLASGVKVNDVDVRQDERKENKRKRNKNKDEKKETALSDPLVSSISCEEEKEVQTGVKKQKRLEEKVSQVAVATDKRISADVSIAHEALDTLSNIKAVNSKNSLKPVAKCLDKVTLADTKIAEPLDSHLRTFEDLVLKVQTLPGSEKVEHITEALKVLQQLMANDAFCSHYVHVQRFAKIVKRWIGERPFQSELGDRYEGFAHNLAEYSCKIYGHNKQVKCQRLATTLLRAIDEKRKQLRSKSQSSKTVSQRTKNARGRLKGIMAQVEQWQDGIFSLSQLEKTIKSFGDVMSYRSDHWNPLADCDARLCIDKLFYCVQMMKKPVYRAKYTKTVTKWKRKIDKHQ